MRVIKCDRCGKEIETYVPDMVTMEPRPKYYNRLRIARKLTNVWEMPVDLCETCEDAVYDFIFHNSFHNSKKKNENN